MRPGLVCRQMIMIKISMVIIPNERICYYRRGKLLCCLCKDRSRMSVVLCNESLLCFFSLSTVCVFAGSSHDSLRNAV